MKESMTRQKIAITVLEEQVAAADLRDRGVDDPPGTKALANPDRNRGLPVAVPVAAVCRGAVPGK